MWMYSQMCSSCDVLGKVFEFKNRMGGWKDEDQRSSRQRAAARRPRPGRGNKTGHWCHSFLVFLMATPLLPSHTKRSSTESGLRSSNSDVPTVQARDHTGAAMFMRATPGCGLLAFLGGISRNSKSEASRRAYETRQARKRAAEEEESSCVDNIYIYILVPGVYSSDISAQ
jgi:hypothetical protein